MDGLISSYATILNNVIKHISPKVAMNENDSEYLKYMNKVAHDEMLYTDTGVTGLGMGEIVPDAGIAASDAPIQGFSKNYTQVLFSKKVRFSYMSNFFMLKGAKAKLKAEVQKKVTDGKRAVEQAKSYLAQSLLAQGFGTSFTWAPLNFPGRSTLVSTLGADSVAYFAATHPREDGGASWTNIVTDGGTVNPAFSYSALLAARRIGADIKDGRGAPTHFSYDTLVCRKGSNTAQLAKSIKATIDKGIAPGQVNIFNNAPATDTFSVLELANWGGLGLTGLNWFLTDSSQKNEDYGFQYIETLATRAEEVFYDGQGNQDFISNFNSLAVLGASDTRTWLASKGTGQA